MLFDGDHRAARPERRQQRRGIAGSDRRHADHFRLDTEVGKLLRRLHHLMHRRTGGHQRDVLAFAQGQHGAGNKAIRLVKQLRQRLAIETNIDRALISKSIVDDLPTFARRGGGEDLDIAKAAHHRQIVNGMVGAGQRAVAGSGVKAEQLDVGVVVTDIHFDLLIGPRDKKRRGVTGHSHFSAQRQTGGGADHALLGDADVHQPAGELFNKRRDFGR